MNFDELWRANLVSQQDPAYSNDEQEVPATREPPSEPPNELHLTVEDRAFLWQVGIRP
jgi:hypothetical protein